MNYFPVFMDLHDQPVVLIGAGAVAERKARLLLKAGAKLRVVARELNPAFQIWQANGSVELLAREYSSQQLRCARLVFAATADQALNRRVFEDAESLGIA
ncbi:MAG TPA: NAD(P)-dependent oxidoreductase, partial [Xanthomonadales bacterium]|nr:NAD(P)-dependent oxidoreductase [Xanthomonadales bacterium]